MAAPRPASTSSRRPPGQPADQPTDWPGTNDDAALAARAVEAGFAQSPVGQSVAARDGRILRANAALCALLGRSADELVGRTWQSVSHPDDVDMCQRELDLLAVAPSRELTTVKRYLRPDGVVVRALLTTSLVEVDGSLCYVARVQDVRVLRDQQDALEAERAVAADLQEGHTALLEAIVRGQPLAVTLGAVARLAERALHGAVAAVHLVDEARAGLDFVAGPGMPLEMVRAGQRLALGPEGGLCGSAAADGQLVVAEVPADPRTAPFRVLAKRMGVHSAWCQPLRDRDGSVLGVLSCYVSRSGGPDHAELRSLELVAGLATVAVERDHVDRALRRQAREDPLTGLANRTQLLERTQRALAAVAEGRQIALLFCDVDRLKPVNDTLGHARGDELLVTVGRRLRSAAPRDATVARLSGDEFVVLLDDVTGTEQATAVAGALVRATSAPLRIDGSEVRVSISVGVAVATPAAPVVPQALDLLRDADMAMYRAKARGRARVELFDRHLHTLSTRTWQLERDLRAAVAAGALEVHYQPQLRVADGTLHGLEALVRWTLPSGERVQPSEFIPIAEDAGLIGDVGAHVLRQACRDAAGIAGDPVVSVNISARQLLDPLLTRVVAAALREARLPGERLCLEITESVLMEDAPGVLDRLSRLRELGVGISIDDLGTGYSSLLYLKRLPVTQLKVDTSFVNGMGADPEDDAIVAAIVGLGSALGIDVVAEGVETDTQLRRLRELGCPLAQGYLLGRPVPVEELALP
jgi:diguanylate cyclase (GGDEF)-like protein/PAS domain S-box-containing protein